MIISDNGIAFIKREEGCILHPYLDKVGRATIGYGTTRYNSGVYVTMKDSPINEGQASLYLKTHVVDIQEAIDDFIEVPLNQNQVDSIISFAYNVGVGGFHGSTLLKRINANPADPTIRDAFMMWDKGHVDGQLVVIEDLKERRGREADLYFSS